MLGIKQEKGAKPVFKDLICQSKRALNNIIKLVA